MLNDIDTLPDELAKADTWLADTGRFSGANVTACEADGIDPLIAPRLSKGRQPHHPQSSERFADAPAPPENVTPVEAMAHRLKATKGRDLYALRKPIPETAFGIIKSGWLSSVHAARDRPVRGEWRPVTMAWKIKRTFVLCPQQ
jgi:hypothetical protein